MAINPQQFKAIATANPRYQTGDRLNKHQQTKKTIMAIDLDGIAPEAEILVSGAATIFISTHNPKLLSEILEMPFYTERLSSGRVSVWTRGIAAIAIAEKIANHWQNEGVSVKRFNRKTGYKALASFTEN